MPDRQIRNLTPAPRRWKVVGLEMADRCTFCGAPSEATVGCPDEAAPLIFQVGVCSHCLTDAVMVRFAEVKAARTARLAMDMSAAAAGSFVTVNHVLGVEHGGEIVRDVRQAGSNS
jgi:hypothetical protein